MHDRELTGALGGHRLVTQDGDLAAALQEEGATLVRASALMVLPLPAEGPATPADVVIGPLRDSPLEYAEVLRRAYPPSHPDHEHGEATLEGAAATINAYTAGEIGTGPLLADASAEARAADGRLLGAIFVSDLPADDALPIFGPIAAQLGLHTSDYFGRFMVHLGQARNV